MDYSERWMRAEIAAIPDGVYEFTERMEDDGVVDRPVTFHVTVNVRGDELVVDWTGTDPQVRGPINATYGVTAGATYNAIFHLTDMGIPKNSGAYRPIRIIAPPGLGGERRLPGPVGGRQHRDAPEAGGHGRRRARAGAARPGRGRRGRHRLQLPLRRLHPRTGDYYANYHLEGGGWGAKSYDDGNDAIVVKNGNCRNTPVEIFETRYPLRVLEYSLIDDSGGPGRMRGGLGTRRVLRVEPGAEVTVNALFDRTKPGLRRLRARRRPQGSGGRDPRQARRRRGVPHVLGGLRHGLPVEVHEHRPHGGRRGADRVAGRRRLRRPARARSHPPRRGRRAGLRLRGRGS